MYLCGGIILGAEFLLVLLLASLDWQCTAQSVDILNLLNLSQLNRSPDRKAYLAGIEAALFSRSYQVGGKTLNLINIENEDFSRDFGSVINKYLERYPDIHFILGPFTGSEVGTSRSVLHEKGLVAFAPFTESVLARYWDPHLYFTSADSNAQLLALIRHAVGPLRVRRLGFMHLSGMKFGDEELKNAHERMRQMGLKLSGVFTYPRRYKGEDADELFVKRFEGFANARPQAVLIFGVPTWETKKFLKMMLMDNRTFGVYILCPMASQARMMKISRNFTKDRRYSRLPSRIFTSRVYPLASDKRLRAVENFRTAMRAFLNTDYGSKYYTNPEYFLENDPAGELMVGGWIAGEALIKALSALDVLTNKSRFMDSLYHQRRYIVHDIVVGDYGGECDTILKQQGVACRCNQGGTTVFLKRLTNEHRLAVVPESQFSFGAQLCSTASFKLLAPCNGIILDLTDVEKVHYAAEMIGRGLRGAFGQVTSASRDFTVKRLSVPTLSAAAQLRDTMASEITTFVAGGVVESVVENASIVFVDPVCAEPCLNTFRRNVLHLAPTLEQELYVLAQFLGGESAAPGPVRAAVRGREAAAVGEVLRQSLQTFGVALDSLDALEAGGAFAEWLPNDGIVFVVGVSPDDVPVIAQRLEDATEMRVFVPFTDFATLYPYFKQNFEGKESARRVVFATSFPHWGDKTTNVSAVKSFHSTFPDTSAQSPLAFWGFRTAAVLQELIQNTQALASKNIIDFVFSRSTFAVDGLVYGPYFDSAYCSTSMETDGNCLSNFGATFLSVWSLERVFTPSVPPLSSPITPTLLYAIPGDNTGIARSTVILAAVLGSVGGALILLTSLGVAWLCCAAGHRGKRNAPVNSRHPVTLIFTDIQSSTALWAACPEVMTDAVETHHRLIRRLIAKHRCYEVKTVGDSFMIACKNPYAAVQLVGDLQRTFLEHDWETEAIDEMYREFEEREAEDDADYEPPTVQLDAAVYRAHWRGLRVRAGVHTGLSDIRHDEVTKRYDYCGSAVNTAARTESIAHGGQVLLTRAAFMALSTAERAELDVTALGAVELRGVPEPVEMLQLNTVPGRAFEKLRSGGGEKEREKSALCDPLFTVLSALFECMRRCLMSLLS